MSADFATVRLALMEDGRTIASERFAITLFSLPAEVRRYVDPTRRVVTPGYRRLANAAIATGEANLTMERTGGEGGIHRICRDTSPAAVARCDSLELTLRSDRPGALTCLSLGADDEFFVLAPPGAAGPPVRIEAGRPLTLPSALGEVPGGGTIVWPPRPPAGNALVMCLLYARAADVPLESLRRFSGRVLSPDEVERVIDVLRRRAPLDGSWSVVNIVEKDT
ncbi:MAG: hypothetical protein AAF318_17850 [Pseudomonadota bacterium]